MWNSFFEEQYVEHIGTGQILEVHTTSPVDGWVTVKHIKDTNIKNTFLQIGSTLRPFWLQKGDKVCIGDEIFMVDEIYLNANNIYVVRFAESSSWAFLTTVETLKFEKLR